MINIYESGDEEAIRQYKNYVRNWIVLCASSTILFAIGLISIFFKVGGLGLLILLSIFQFGILGISVRYFIKTGGFYLRIKRGNNE